VLITAMAAERGSRFKVPAAGPRALEKKIKF